MKNLRQDFSILEKFDFSFKPVAIKFLLNKSDGVEKLVKNMPICKMFRETQEMSSFYASADNFTCVDRLVLGFMDPESIYESGQIGAKERIYQDARTNRRIYQYIEKIPTDTIRYVAFARVH